jgi:WD40 repeat protein
MQCLDHDADGGLVFVSYSHHDREWMRRLLVLLTPLVRNRGLRVWADEYIQVGDEWRRDIAAAVKRSRVALLLVSADFLSSRFILEEELPALRQHGVRLAPVLLHDCLWEHESLLSEVQWIHDPGRDGPLDRATDAGGRDRKLADLCRRLDAELVLPGSAPMSPPRAIERPGSAPTSPPRAIERIAPVERIEEAASQLLGDLDGVPSLPQGYLARAGLDDLIERLLGAGSGAIGLTGDARTLGLFGQGGIGKSVQAIAVARDERVRAAFPDGVYWVTVGENGDLISAQLDLLGRLGVRDISLRTSSEGRKLLERVLAGRRVLLVIDDVWSDAAAMAFRATGAGGRVIYTTRDASVLRVVDARVERVDVLPRPAARQLLANLSGTPIELLSAEVERVLETTGGVPLALALVATAVRSGTTWEAITAELTQSTETFLDHPYADTFNALQVATVALPKGLADQYLSLAVYPKDTRIPVAAVARYWQHLYGTMPQQTLVDLQTFAHRGLLVLDSDEITLHDLQHDFLLLHVDDLPLRHADLLTAYQQLLPPVGDGWWQLPPAEPYIADHLAYHLAEAGFRDVLVATVTDLLYLTVRVARSGPQAAEADLRTASRLTPNNTQIAWLCRWLARSGHLFTGFDDPAKLAPTLASSLADVPVGIDQERLRSLLPLVYLVPRWGIIGSSALVRVLTGHAGPIMTMAFSADAQLLATAGLDRVVRLWDIPSGREQAQFIGHTNSVLAIAFGPDNQLITVGHDNSARSWDLAAGGGEPRITAVPTFMTPQVVLSPGAELLTTVDHNYTVHVWDVASGCERAQFAGHSDSITAIAFSPSTRLLATASYDDTVRLWNIATGYQQTQLEGDTKWVTELSFSPDGQLLAGAGAGRAIQLWDVSTGLEQARFNGFLNAADGLAFSPDGRLLATACDRTIRLWDISTRREQAQLDGHTGRMGVTAFSPDGQLLASAGSDSTVRLWDVASGREQAPPGGHTSWVRTVLFSPDRQLVATAGHDRTVRLWEAATGRERAELNGHADVVSELAFNPTGRLLASASFDRTIRIWDLATGREQARIVTPDPYGATTMAFTANGQLLATAGHDDTVRLWDVVTGHQQTQITYAGCRRGIPAVFSRDSQLLATKGLDGAVRLWDLTSGRERASLTENTLTLRAVVFSPDAEQLATVSDATVRLWDVATGREQGRLTGHGGPVHAIAFSPDGRLLATAGDDETVRLWDIESQSQLASLRLGTAVTAIDWSSLGIAIALTTNIALLEPARPALKGAASSRED